MKLKSFHISVRIHLCNDTSWKSLHFCLSSCIILSFALLPIKLGSFSALSQLRSILPPLSKETWGIIAVINRPFLGFPTEINGLPMDSGAGSSGGGLDSLVGKNPL
jgi:hypothetical protein